MVHVDMDFGVIGKQVLWFMAGKTCILLHGRNSPNSLQEELTDALNAPVICSVAVIEALRYKPEGRGIDSRWCHWNFSLT
jgi:hypothetical protein